MFTSTHAVRSAGQLVQYSSLWGGCWQEGPREAGVSLTCAWSAFLACTSHHTVHQTTDLSCSSHWLQSYFLTVVNRVLHTADQNSTSLTLWYIYLYVMFFNGLYVFPVFLSLVKSITWLFLTQRVTPNDWPVGNLRLGKTWCFFLLQPLMLNPI